MIPPPAMIPAPDSPLQIPLQAAQRLLELGVLPPWDVSAPLGPVLIAALAWLPGVSPAGALWLTVALAALLTALSCAWLLAPRVSLGWAFATVLLAPVQWLLLTDSLDRFLFWRIATLLIVLVAGRARLTVRVAGAVTLALLLPLTSPPDLGLFDAAALAEIFLVLRFVGSRWLAPAFGTAAAVVVIVAATGAAMPGALVAEARAAAAGRVVGPRDVTLEEVPLLREARRFALDHLDSPVSLKWLRAVGARHVALPLDSAGADRLAVDAVQDAGGFRLHRLLTPAPEAVLVSRSRFDMLPPIRGLQDAEALDAYLLWSSRLEAVGVDRSVAGEIRLTTDLGPDDLVLFRLPRRPGLAADVREGDRWTPGEMRADPLGFVVLAAPAPGPRVFRIRSSGTWRERFEPDIPARPLLTGPFPAIALGSVVDGRTFKPSPFQAGEYLSVFGERFDLFEPRIRLDERRIKPFYASATQLNFQLPEDVAPGKHEVRVESGGKQSLAEPIEVQANETPAVKFPPVKFRAVRVAIVAALALPVGLAAQQAPQIGFYQWQGVNPDGAADLLSAARRRTTAMGGTLFRLYLGARFDYRHPLLSPQRFEGELSGPATPAAILDIERYGAVLEDPAFKTVVLTAYSAIDYGAGPDDVNLLRPWSDREDRAVREQIGALCRLLFERYGELDKTVVIANHEADEKLMEILNHTPDPDLAIGNLAAWSAARFEAIAQARLEFPQAKLRILHAFEISAVNLNIGFVRDRYVKTTRAGWNALHDVLPHIRTDLVSYSAYESTNSPYQTLDINQPPEETATRLTRDLNLIREAAKGRISETGKEFFGDEFVMIGELGLPRERYEGLSTGGLLPRWLRAVRAGVDWGCPFVVLWQVFDAPRLGTEAWGFGAYDKTGAAPVLDDPSTSCGTIASCVKLLTSGRRVD